MQQNVRNIQCRMLEAKMIDCRHHSYNSYWSMYKKSCISPVPFWGNVFRYVKMMRNPRDVLHLCA